MIYVEISWNKLEVHFDSQNANIQNDYFLNTGLKSSQDYSTHCLPQAKSEH